MSAPRRTPTGVPRALYAGVWSFLVRWFRVPAQPPTLPDANAKSFGPAPGFERYLEFWFLVPAALLALAIAVGWVAVMIALPWLGALLAPLFVLKGTAVAIVQWIALHLRFDTTWYVMTPKSLRLRRGIWLIHEMTVTFENVQNVSVKQGPVERLFGIASVVLETAGAGGDSRRAGAVGNRAVIEGVSNAPELRDLIFERMRASRSAGLGDEEPRAAGGVTTARGGLGDAHIEVLREILQIVRGQTA